ncbi:MAG: hypothetical protein B6226_04405 [Candidatus Cloacimonetes bacterium 4572_65]|nr:MAG: hypothetical protein B6226_04405 [Candidatus Cloacimonetes bacterium 4572_65]
MYMIFQLFYEKYISDVLMALAEAGVEDTIVLSGEATGHKLIFDNPLFASFRDTYGAQRDYGKIIMGVADEEQVEFIVDELKHAGVDIIGDELGKIVLLQSQRVFG